MLNLIIILAAITQGLVGLFVYRKKSDSWTNRAFAILSLASLLWAVTNYLYTLNPESSYVLSITRFVLFWVVAQNTAFYIFARSYPSSKLLVSIKKLWIVLLFSLVTALLTISPYIFISVTIINGQANPNPSPLIGLFILNAIYTIGGGIGSLIKKERKAQSIEKSQLKFILVASVLNWVVVPITNFVITLALHVTFFAKIGPIYTLLFAGIIGYAIVAQKLFDIKAAVARSVTYILVLGTFTMVYGLALFGIVDEVFKGTSDELLRQIISVVAIIPLVLSFQNVKQFFDRTSRRLFYKDNYDTQEVLDSIGGIVVAEIDLGKVINMTREVLAGVLKSTFFEFVLMRDRQPQFETNHQLAAQLEKLDKRLSSQNQELLVTEDLDRNNVLSEPLRLANVALSLRLKTQRQIVGYILIGDKRSGDIYSPQDKKLLTIVASELAIAIQNALRFEEIQSFNVTLQQKVDEATRKLRVSNQKLKSLDETKDDFISMASHQLRTPLTSVKGYVSMVLDGDAGEITPMQRKLLTQSFISSQRMVYLIADLLNISRLKTGKFVIEPVPTNLADALAGEVDQLVETAKGRNLTLTYHRPDNFPTYMLDETKIRQVMMNFMDNAIYYTPSGGHIDVEVKNNPSDIVYTVTDDGIGVPKEQQHHLFSKFYRAPNALRARPDGTGLGLYMAKKVVLAQRGSIIFKSTEGKGSTFGFSFSKSNLVLAPEKKTFVTK